MRKIVFFVFLFIILTMSVVSGQQTKLRITAPTNKTQISERVFIEGTIDDPKLKVWIIVHPMGLPSYWVQPPITAGENGTWEGMIYIGRAGSLDSGKEFEIMAVASPKTKIREGNVLDRWPSARWTSQIMELIRK